MNFNPYFSQIPVDDYVRVGMIKQGEYDAGVHKVQSYIDSVSGIDVIKPEQKDYLQQRVQQLEGEVSKIVSRDFSNQQIVNSVGNLASKIASDPIIQSAEASTKAYRAGSAAMKKARDEGKSSPSNEWLFNKQFTDWYNDRDVTSAFKGQFNPYTDVNKKVVDIIRALEPNAQIEDIPFKRGTGGEIVLGADGIPEIDFAMMEKSSKTLTPERIQAALRANLDQNDLRQLQIDGMYTYRGYDKAGMKGITDQSYNYRLGQINSAIQGLMLDRQTNVSDTQHVAQVDAKIAALKQRAEQYQQNYKRDIGNLDKDPEGFKGNLYTDSWLTRFGDGFAYAQNSLTYKENPYFMAAERRRENDIKFQEFLVNKQFEAARIAIDQERLAIERDRANTYKLLAKAKLKSEGGGDEFGLPLTGDVILDAIPMDELERITQDTFVGDTEVMSQGIDSQKMALLAQVRPDLVGVVRDADGKNPRYEYLVQGKNPTAVKSEAEASLLKIKDSYDKGEDVPDGAKVYFQNLGNTSERVENRKFALGEIMKDANSKWDVNSLLRKVSPLRVGNQVMSPQQQMEFNQKLEQVSRQVRDEKGDSYTSYDSQKAAQLMTSPAEKRLFDLVRQPKYALNPEEKNLVNRIEGVRNAVNEPAKKFIEGRQTYIGNAMRSIVSVSQPTEFPLEAFKNEMKGRAQSVVVNLFNNIVKEDKGNTNPYYDKKDISSMLEDQDTKFALVSRGPGRYAVRLSNTKVSNEPREMDITAVQAENLFGAGKFINDFQGIKEGLDLTRNKGKVTTDVRGLGRESAFSVQNGLLNKYGVKYHVEEPLKNGGLQLKLYIYDKANKKWEERDATFGQLLNEAQVTRFISLMSDQYIDGLLQQK